MSSWKRVGGLDPSLSNFGMVIGTAFYDDDESLLKFEPEDIALSTSKTDKSIKYKNEDDLQRARTLGSAMLRFFEGVDTIYVEIPVGSQSARAMASYGICVGIIAALGKRVVRISAKDVKVVATGNPTATKEDMINWATSKYPDLPWLKRTVKNKHVLKSSNEHIADAMAAIHVGLKLT